MADAMYGKRKICGNDDILLIEVIRAQQETIRLLQEYILKLNTTNSIEEYPVIQLAEAVEVSEKQNEIDECKPKKLGEWLSCVDRMDHGNTTLKCSVCGKYIPHKLSNETLTKCPFCGTQMKKGYRCVEWYDFKEKYVSMRTKLKHTHWHPVLDPELDVEDEPAWIEMDQYWIYDPDVQRRYAKCNKCGHQIPITKEMWKDTSLLPHKCPKCGVEIHKSHFWTTWYRCRYPFHTDFWSFSGATCFACGAAAPKTEFNGFNVGILTSRCPSCGKHMTTDRCVLHDGLVIDKTLKEEFEWRMIEDE